MEKIDWPAQYRGEGGFVDECDASRLALCGVSRALRGAPGAKTFPRAVQ